MTTPHGIIVLIYIQLFANCFGPTFQTDQRCKDVRCPPQPEERCPPDYVLLVFYEKSTTNDQDIPNSMTTDSKDLFFYTNDPSHMHDNNEEIDNPINDHNGRDAVSHDQHEEHNIKKRSFQSDQPSTIETIPEHITKIFNNLNTNNDYNETEKKLIECCPQYKCLPEPRNCSVIGNADNYWLKRCVKCQCLDSEIICHNLCAEEHLQAPNCFSVALNRPFFEGDKWKEDVCTECHCENNNKTCLASMCKGLNCPKQVKLPGECCPTCLHDITPAIAIRTSTEEPVINATTPHRTEVIEDVTDVVPPIVAISTESSPKPVHTITTESTSISTMPDIPISTTTAPPPTDNVTSSPPSEQTSTTDKQSQSPDLLAEPCQQQTSTTPSAVAKDLPAESVESDDANSHSHIFFYLFIAVFVAATIILAILYIRERGRNRSYRSVPSFDSNLNKLPLPIATD